VRGYNFTERVRKTLALAREEAIRLRHEYVGTEHMLLGLIRGDDGVAIEVMRTLSVDPERVRDEILRILREGIAGSASSDLPYTSRAKRVLELAMTEARLLGHQYVGTEHLLLGLLGEQHGVAAQALDSAGLTLEKARAETLRLLGTEPAEREFRREAHVARPAREGAEPVAFLVELVFADGSTERREFQNRLEALRFLIQA
jgi:ATP-dependent Clp protease ATP-binding subunit ClpC